MPIRLVKKELSMISYDAEVRPLKTNSEESLTKSIKKNKIVFFVKFPQWIDGNHGEVELLTQCYADVLKLADENNCESVVFPLEIKGCSFPKDKIYSIAIKAISDYLNNSELMVYLAISNVRTLRTNFLLKDKLLEYLSEVYLPAKKRKSLFVRIWKCIKRFFNPFDPNEIQSALDDYTTSTVETRNKAKELQRKTLKELLEKKHKGYIKIPDSVIEKLKEMLKLEPEETFTEMMERLIDEKGMKPSQCYKRANMDKRHFSKIKCDKNYHPKKETAITLALALELDLEQTKQFLMKAGYALSHTDKRDVIVEFFIKEKQYNLMEIDTFLFEQGLKLLSNYE